MKHGKKVLFYGEIFIMMVLSGCISTNTMDSSSPDKESNAAVSSEALPEAKKHLKMEKCYNSHGRMEMLFEYDERGNMTAKYVYNEDGSINWEYTRIWEYDEMGNMTVEDRHSEKSVWKYDSEGRVTADNYYSKTFTAEQIYEYDQNGNMISNCIFEQGNYAEWNGYYETYEYNQDGNLTVQYHYKPDGTRYVDIRREYDDNGWWLNIPTALMAPYSGRVCIQMNMNMTSIITNGCSILTRMTAQNT